jgi:tetratricopeptide (TPR) repeat protein
MLNQINPEEGGIALFKKIWTTECRGFRNESQNYSQIALASIVLFENMLHEDGDTVFLVRGDRLMSAYKRPVLDKEGARTLLNSAMEAYQQDLLDGVIPFEYFFTRINRIQKELAWIDINKQEKNDNALAQILPLTDDQAVNLGKQLLRKRRAEDAVRVLKLNIERYPYSIAAYDSLGYAYRMLGKNDLAVKYFSKSEEIKGGKLLSE